MPASILDGKNLATKRLEKLALDIDFKKSLGFPVPSLAVILIGNDFASKIYVDNKRKACLEVGIDSLYYNLPDNTSEKELLQLIEELNNKPFIHGILVQLPLPAQINTTAVIEKIHPDKDVDGFHPYNLGRLAQRIPLLRPCTPLGVMNLLEHYKIPAKSQHAVVVGASNIVGRPMSLELLLAGATVTICHKFTKNLEKHVAAADILVVATGSPDLINPQWLLPKQVVIDVGIHRLANGSIRGDVDFEKAAQKVAWITPVPGGVGPMTISSLLENTFWAAYQRNN